MMNFSAKAMSTTRGLSKATTTHNKARSKSVVEALWSAFTKPPRLGCRVAHNKQSSKSAQVLAEAQGSMATSKGSVPA